jgi:hypothetical protein
LAYLETLYSFTDGGDSASEFVSKGAGESFEDAGMTASVSFEVGAAGEGCANFDQEFTGTRLRNGQILVT